MLKIYLAEDDAAIRESIIRNIKWEQHGYELVGQAPDGETAYNEIKTLFPDVLITDLKMPFMDGLELSRRLRKEMPEIKIIVLTGYSDFESVQEALNIGVTKFLLKPATPSALVETITEVRDIVHQEKEYRAQRSEYLESIARQRDLTSADIGSIKVDRAAVRQFLREGRIDDTETKVEEFIDSIGREKLDSIYLLQYIIMDFKFIAAEFLDDIGIKNESILKNFEDIQVSSAKLMTVPETVSYLTSLIKCAINLRNRNMGKRYDRTVEKAQDYIRSAYSDENISLVTVAKHVNLSPAHFSTVFSQESGKTFTEFLTQVRIDKAKELLLCSSKRSSEIAFDVGYQDSHYFSFVFKKVTGASPREFRSNAKGGGTAQ